MRRAIARVLVGLLVLALDAGPGAARRSDSSEALDGQILAPPEERDAFAAALSAAPLPLDPVPLPRLGLGSLLGLGFDVGPFRLLDPGTAVSFDLRLRWPGVPGSDTLDPRGLQPYVSLGPALFVSDPPDVGGPFGPRADATLAVGVKAGAGLSWQLDRGAALFGEYRITRGNADLLGPIGGRSTGEVSGFDVFYGLRLRF